MKKTKTKGKPVRRIVLGVVAAIVLFVAVVLMIVALPYAGPLKVSGATRENFDLASFYGEGEGDRVTLLAEPRAAFRHRIHLVDSAAEVVNFSTHECVAGEVQDVFFGALLAAADRGVAVNVIADGKMGDIDQHIRALLIRHENIKLYDYSPFSPFRLRYAAVDLHDKILTVDGTYMIIGGRNTGDRYFAQPGSGDVSIDREVLVYRPAGGPGGAVERVDAYYAALTAASLTKARTQASDKAVGRAAETGARIAAAYRAYLAENPADIDYERDTYAVNKITVLTNPVEGTKRSPDILYNLGRIAKETGGATIQTPYVVMTNADRKLFARFAADTDIRIVTNTLANTHNIPAFSVYQHTRRDYARAGIEVRECQSADNIHAKAWLFDGEDGGRLSAVGSFNLDERSIRIDTEIMLLIDSPQFFAELQADIDRYADNALTLGGDGKLIADENVEPLAVPRGKKFLYGMAGVLGGMVKYLI